MKRSVIVCSTVFALTVRAYGAAAAQPSLVSIAFDSPLVLIDRPQVSQHLLVSGKFSDGSVRDVTALARFWSANERIATVSRDGVVTAVGDGKVRIDANVNGKRARCAVTVTNARKDVEYRFATHIAPILTRMGCNGSNCHGSPVGKNGFKLSLFAYEPEADWQMIVKAHGGRRVSLQAPTQSLLLRKPTLAEKHGGGQRFAVGSAEYQAILNYLQSGAPAPNRDDVTIARLEASPNGRVLVAATQTQQLLVSAHYSDGTREDVTTRAQFSSNDEGVATVTPSGVVTAVGTGEAPIMIRYGGKVSVAVIAATLLPRVAVTDRVNNVIDRYLFAKLKQLRIPASDSCTDNEFVRRAFLDLIGTLPTAEEVRAFLVDLSLNKRAQLIDTLLARSEYADLQALLWADRLRSNSRFHRVGGVKAYQAWLKQAFTDNMPLDAFARALVTARGANYDAKTGNANYWGSYDTTLAPEEVAPQTSQLFLGVRIHCAQCHNHPFEKWTQNDFYAMAAVFAHVKSKGTKNSQEFELYLDPTAKMLHPATRQVMTPRAMESPPFALPPGAVPVTSDAADLRVPFADWLTSPDNPYFARAMVNRLWRQFMGRGLVEPVDDFRVTNPPTHPELLDALAKELVAHQFDQKHIIRLICNSRAYQLSSAPNGVAVTDRSNKYYSRFAPKRLMAEVYLDAVCQATGVAEEFKAWPEARRSIQLPDNRYASYFLDTFNRTNRLVICDREEEGTMSQALNLINGTEIQSKICHLNGALRQLLNSEKSDTAIVDELFLRTLSRLPTSADRERLAKQLAGVPRPEAMTDLLWALLSSREFLFNH